MQDEQIEKILNMLCQGRAVKEVARILSLEEREIEQIKKIHIAINEITSPLSENDLREALNMETVTNQKDNRSNMIQDNMSFSITKWAYALVSIFIVLGAIYYSGDADKPAIMSEINDNDIEELDSLIASITNEDVFINVTEEASLDDIETELKEISNIYDQI